MVAQNNLEAQLVQLIATCLVAINNLDRQALPFAAISIQASDIQCSENALISCGLAITYTCNNEDYDSSECVEGSPTHKIITQFELEVQELLSQHWQKLRCTSSYYLKFDLMQRELILHERLKKAPSINEYTGGK